MQAAIHQLKLPSELVSLQLGKAQKDVHSLNRVCVRKGGRVVKNPAFLHLSSLSSSFQLLNNHKYEVLMETCYDDGHSPARRSLRRQIR